MALSVTALRNASIVVMGRVIWRFLKVRVSVELPFSLVLWIRSLILSRSMVLMTTGTPLMRLASTAGELA